MLDLSLRVVWPPPMFTLSFPLRMPAVFLPVNSPVNIWLMNFLGPSERTSVRTTPNRNLARNTNKTFV